MFKTAKKGEKNVYKEFSRFWMWPYRIFSKGLIHDFESKFEGVFLIFFLFCLNRVRKDVCRRLRLLKRRKRNFCKEFQQFCTRRENHQCPLSSTVINIHSFCLLYNSVTIIPLHLRMNYVRMIYLLQQQKKQILWKHRYSS